MDSSSASTGLCPQLSLSCVHQCSPNSRAEWNSISVKLSIIYLSISLSICASILHLPPLSYHYLFSIIYLPFTFLSCLSICLPISLATIHPPSFGLNVHGPHRLMYWTLGTHLVVIFSKATELFRHVSQIVTSRCLGLGLEDRYLLLALA